MNPYSKPKLNFVEIYHLKLPIQMFFFRFFKIKLFFQDKKMYLQVKLKILSKFFFRNLPSETYHSKNNFFLIFQDKNIFASKNFRNLPYQSFVRQDSPYISRIEIVS